MELSAASTTYEDPTCVRNVVSTCSKSRSTTAGYCETTTSGKCGKLSRKEKNRLSAMRSRIRKQEIVAGLEAEVNTFGTQKHELQATVAAMEQRCARLRRLWESSVELKGSQHGEHESACCDVSVQPGPDVGSAAGPAAERHNGDGLPVTNTTRADSGIELEMELTSDAAKDIDSILRNLPGYIGSHIPQAPTTATHATSTFPLDLSEILGL